jgi:hypothetical protein
VRVSSTGSHAAAHTLREFGIDVMRSLAGRRREPVSSPRAAPCGEREMADILNGVQREVIRQLRELM